MFSFFVFRNIYDIISKNEDKKMIDYKMTQKDIEEWCLNHICSKCKYNDVYCKIRNNIFEKCENCKNRLCEKCEFYK